MASQSISSSTVEVLEIDSYIEAIMLIRMWSAVIGESLLVKREPSNSKDANAVAVHEDNVIVGYVPYSLAQSISHFFKTRHE